MTQPSQILLSDTNILLKMLLFDGLDLTKQIYPSFGTIKFHPIVQDEISEWKRKYASRGKHKKVEKFGLPLIEKAISISRTQVQQVSSPTAAQKTASFAQYEKILGTISTASAAPTDNDWMLLYHAETGGHYMVTNDDGVYKVGKKVIEGKSLELEDLIIDLLVAGVITVKQVTDYVQKISRMDEYLNLSKVLHKEVLAKIK